MGDNWTGTLVLAASALKGNDDFVDISSFSVLSVLTGGSTHTFTVSGQHNVTGTMNVAGATDVGSLTVDNFTLDGTELDLSSGDFTVDVAGNIEINADGGTITFKDNTVSLGTITSSGYSGNAATATALAAGVTIGMTGDVTWTSPSFDGSGNVTAAATIAADAVHADMLNDDLMSGQDLELTSGLASTDEFLISDAGAVKRMDVSVLQTYMQSNLTFTTDTNTTYSHEWVDSSTNAILRLAAGGSGSGNDDLTIVAGDNITLTPAGDNLTIAATDTDTTYTAGNGLVLASTTFKIDDPINLSELTEVTDATDDKILLWDESASLWKYMTLDNLQDSIDTTGGGGGSQNLFETVAVAGQTSVVAGSTTDTLTLAAGDNVTITTTAGTDTVTFAATDTDTTYTAGNGLTLTSTTFDIDAAQTVITSILATDLKIGEDDQTKIDFETADTINFYAGNEKQLVLTDGALTPGTNAIVDLGTDALEFKDGYFDGTLEADAITIGGTNIVTGGVISSLDATVISGLTDVTSDDADYLLIWDATDSALRKVDAGELRGGGGGGSSEWTDTGSVLHPADGASSDLAVVIGGTTTANSDIILSAAGTDSTPKDLAVFNEQGEAVNFRVESDTNSNMLLVDGVNDRVSIGAASPQSELTVAGTVSATNGYSAGVKAHQHLKAANGQKVLYDLNGPSLQTMTLSSKQIDTMIVPEGETMPTGKTITCRVSAFDWSQPLTWHPCMRFVGETPLVLAKDKVALLTVTTFGPVCAAAGTGLPSDIVCSWAVED